ncbi:cyclin-dependent kinase 20-like isoform X2 [Lycorma delicatula]|uniref:cyclin-dependent kinase 20-like isoform X2 n=1 Tax=Lycorma delicatula TaxID=130591 RepID=UPI003F519DEE
MEQYNVEGRVGEGAHGLVLMAKHIPTGREVALKKVLLKKVEEGIPNSVVREIKSLQEIDCKYDLKPANLLISSNGVLRIADLGLGRVVWSGNASSDNRLYSHQVATRWYRAPELLYGARRYNCAIDLWAVGCILAELNNRSPLFPGETDIDQLAIVLRSLGTPTEASWPGLTSLPDYNKISFPPARPLPWSTLLPDASPTTIDLARQFLVYDTEKRLSAKKALAHAYFYSPPLPCSLEEMPHPPPDHRQRLKSKQISVDKPMRQLFNTLHSYFND